MANYYVKERALSITCKTKEDGKLLEEILKRSKTQMNQGVFSKGDEVEAVMVYTKEDLQGFIDDENKWADVMGNYGSMIIDEAIGHVQEYVLPEIMYLVEND